MKGGTELTHLADNTVEFFQGVNTKKDLLELVGGEQWALKTIPEPDAYVKQTVKQLLSGIIKATGCTATKVYLSKGDCFRVGIYPKYKANRIGMPKPIHLPTIEGYLVDSWGAEFFEEIEADDGMGIYQTAANNRGEHTVICTLDKDLDVIPGLHYNWNKKEVYVVSQDEALMNFYSQMLTGDTVDNIPGLKGYGKKTAMKLLAEATPSEWPQLVADEYTKYGWGQEEYERNARLLWILRDSLENTYGKSYKDFF